MFSPPDADYIFIYGMLRRGRGRHINCVLNQRGIFIGDGVFRGRLYDIGHYPGAVYSNSESDLVKGDVYLLPEPESVLEVLDRFEGCTPDGASRGEFFRERTTVFLENRRGVLALIYIYNRATEGLRVVQSGDYFER
jgi:gamma-glutamylcyclotransferase (GGCT)/AIG2-like uncharacterized protein YtfP